MPVWMRCSIRGLKFLQMCGTHSTWLQVLINGLDARNKSLRTIKIGGHDLHLFCSSTNYIHEARKGPSPKLGIKHKFPGGAYAVLEASNVMLPLK